MVRCEVINQELTISKNFKRLQNIKRVKSNEEIKDINHFEIGDTFETDEEYASYLAGETDKQPIVCIKILEVIPEVIIDEKKVKEIVVKKPITKKSKKVK